MNHIRSIAAIAAAATLMNCSSMTPQQQGTAAGAVIGAAAGAGILSIAGGSAWNGAVAGAVAGGVAGRIRAGGHD